MMRTIPAAVLLALGSGGLLTACTNHADPSEMATVERMIEETDSMRMELIGMDTTALHHMHALFEAERPGIDQRFQDTLLPHEAQVLGNYYQAMAERLPRLLSDRNMEEARIDSTLMRLRNLRHDMDQGLMNKKTREKALALENEWNTSLRNDLDRVEVATKQLIRDRTTYRATIDSLLRQ